MLFNQLKLGDQVYVLEVIGTFKKNTMYSIGTITQVSSVYDEPLPQGLLPIPGLARKKLVDICIASDGETKRLTVPAERSYINDASIGLTVATDRNEIAEQVRSTYNTYKTKIEAILRYLEEMDKCKDILNLLEAPIELTKVDTIDSMQLINELKNEITDIKNTIAEAKKMFTSFRPPMPPAVIQH